MLNFKLIGTTFRSFNSQVGANCPVSPFDFPSPTMSYQEIWAPWRLAYVTSTEKKDPQDFSKLNFLKGADVKCFICQAAADSPEHDAERYVLQRNKRSLVIMNRYPYNNGHLLVTPRRHVGRLELLMSSAAFLS